MQNFSMVPFFLPEIVLTFVGAIGSIIFVILELKLSTRSLTEAKVSGGNQKRMAP